METANALLTSVSIELVELIRKARKPDLLFDRLDTETKTSTEDIDHLFVCHVSVNLSNSLKSLHCYLCEHIKRICRNAHVTDMIKVCRLLYDTSIRYLKQMDIAYEPFTVYRYFACGVLIASKIYMDYCLPDDYWAAVCKTDVDQLSQMEMKICAKLNWKLLF